jgi:hypothetical protein
VGDFLDHAVADPFSSKTSHRPEIIFALNNREPRDAVIEHGSGRREGRIFKRYIDRISEE